MTMKTAVAPRDASPTAVNTFVTPQGIEVWQVESDVVPLVAMAFTFEGGAAQDPANRPGVAQMLSRLLD
jgi:zinc protease